MNTDERASRAKGLAAALLRWALGLIFLVGGVAKLCMLNGFVTGYLLPTFGKTFLPASLLTAYGYALPFVETAIGVLLLIGVCPVATLVVAGLTLLSLAFGQMLIQGQAVVANIMLYLLMTAAALYGQEYDRCVCSRCCCKPAAKKTDG